MTLTNSLLNKSYPSKVTYDAYVTATSLDTTTTINGPAVDTAGLAIRDIEAVVVATKAGAAGTTGLLTLQGSMNGTAWYSLKDTSAASIATSATTIGAATAATPVVLQMGTDQKSRRYFADKYVRASLAIGGTAGFTGTIALSLSLDNTHRVN